MTNFWTTGILGLITAAALGACVAPAGEASNGESSSEVTENSFNPNNVLDDASLLGKKSLTEECVQKILESTPWGSRSVLADYTEDGESAATILVRASTSSGVNPLVLLVRLQMEQALLSRTSAPSSTLDIAFGCGCPHSPLCSDKYMGFSNQASCAAETLRRSVDRASTSTGTVSGWKVGVRKKTQDGIEVTPANATTAALYTYTPWVGEAGGGKAGVGGASLHHKIWTRLSDATQGACGVHSGTSEPKGPDAGHDGSTTPSDPSPDPGGASADAAAPTCSDCCVSDNDCGGRTSGSVCSDATRHCVAGCRASEIEGNGCPAGGTCSVATTGIGRCVAVPPPRDASAPKCTDCCVIDDDCGGKTSGRVCSEAGHCMAGCRGSDSRGNGCPSGLTCSIETTGLGSCVRTPPAPDAGTDPTPPPAVDAGGRRVPDPPRATPPDGSDDDGIVGEGNLTPSSNGPPHRVGSSAAKAAGCSASGATGEAPTFVLLAGAVVLGNLRRRRKVRAPVGR